MAEVDIPDFFIALVLAQSGSSRGPNEEETDQVRKKTQSFWSKQLKHALKSKKHSFDKLLLTVKDAKYGPVEGIENLADKFNMLIEFGAKAVFESEKAPNGNQIFQKMVAGDSMAYLCEFVKKLASDSPYSTAIEVCARRMNDDGSNEVFVVKAPPFFVAIGLGEPSSEDEDRPPTEKEIKKFQKKTKEQIVTLLEREYPDTFLECELELLKADNGPKSDGDPFSIYYYEAVTATFSSDPPNSDELFAVIMQCVGSDFTHYVYGLREIDGSPYMAVSTVSIQVCGMEAPEAEDLESLPPPSPEEKKKPESEEEEKEEESGDEGEPEDGEPVGEPKTKPKEEQKTRSADEELVNRQVPVFLALAVYAEPPSDLPKEKELELFKDLVLRYFYTILKRDYPDNLLTMKLAEKETKFGAGIPEPRYNMCVEYLADITFKKKDAPDEKTLRKLVIKVDIGSLLTHIKNLEPLCFAKTSEVSMRKKPKAHKRETKTIEDGKFEAAIELLPASEPEPELPTQTKEKDGLPEPMKVGQCQAKKRPKKPVSAPAAQLGAGRKSEPELEPKPEPEVPTLVDEKGGLPEPMKGGQFQPKKRPKKKPVPTPAVDTELEPTTESTPKKEKKKKKSEAEPREVIGSSEPKELEDGFIRVSCTEVCIALNLMSCNEDPSDAAYEKLRKNTSKFFAKQ